MFLKRSSVILNILKKSLGSVLFSRDGWVTADIDTFFGLRIVSVSCNFENGFSHSGERSNVFLDISKAFDEVETKD